MKNIASLGYKIVDNGIEFYPFMVMDGRRTFAVEDLSEEDYQVLKLAMPYELQKQIFVLFQKE